MDNGTVCKATEKDITELVELVKKTLTNSPPKGIGKKYITAYIKGTAAHDLIENSINRIIVLKVQDRLIGFAIINMNDTHFIEFILIDSDYQRHGYGTYFFEKLYDTPYEIRAIDCYSKDIATRSFIEKQNWEPRWKFRRNGEEIDRMTYIAPLDQIVVHLNFTDKEKNYIRDLW